MFRGRGLSSVERFTWVLLQSLWVGGIWVTLLVVFPALGKSVLAPILVYEIITGLEPRLIILILICTFVQLVLFIKTSGFILLFKNVTGVGITLAFLVSVVFLISSKMQLFGYHTRGSLLFFIAFLGIIVMFYLPPWLQHQREIYNNS